MRFMNKQDAIKLLGGTTSAAAKAVGISYQAVRKWPDTLPPRIVDRVDAALSRISRDRQPRKTKPELAAKAVA